jgi:transposase
VDRLTALCFTASSAVHAWKSVYDLSAVINSVCSQLQLVNSVVHHGAAYFRATCIDDTHVKYGSASKCRQKFRCKFNDERVPSRHTIHNLVNELRTTGLLIDKKQNHKRRVHTEEKLDAIGTRLEYTPRKSLKHLAQETGVSKSSARRATQLLKLRLYKTAV